MKNNQNPFRVRILDLLWQLRNVPKSTPKDAKTAKDHIRQLVSTIDDTCGNVWRIDNDDLSKRLFVALMALKSALGWGVGIIAAPMADLGNHQKMCAAADQKFGRDLELMAVEVTIAKWPSITEFTIPENVKLSVATAARVNELRKKMTTEATAALKENSVDRACKWINLHHGHTNEQLAKGIGLSLSRVKSTDFSNALRARGYRNNGRGKGGWSPLKVLKVSKVSSQH